jgi:hypothetical protein
VKDASRSHSRAIFDMLAPLHDLDEGYLIFFGKVDVPDSALTYPYLVVWGQAGTRGIVNLAGNLSDLTTVTQVTGVGRDIDETIAVLDRAGELLHGHRPTILGRLPGLIRQVPTGEQIRANEILRTPDGQPTYRGVALFELDSTAGPAAP